MPTPQDSLAEADQHIAEGEARTARQRALASELRRDGHHAAATRAEGLLDVMEQSLEGMQRHRALVAAEVDEERRDQL